MYMKIMSILRNFSHMPTRCSEFVMYVWLCPWLVNAMSILLLLLLLMQCVGAGVPE